MILVSKSVIMQRNSAKERIQISKPGVEEGDVLDAVEQAPGGTNVESGELNASFSFFSVPG